MGSRTYDDGWDGGNYWSHIGYPGDLATGTRPSFQGSFSLNGEPTIGGMPADRGFRDRAGIPADGGQRNCAVSAS